jgi:hypothetical protein
MEFWPEDQWNNAAHIAYLESGFNGTAVADTTSSDRPCGTRLDTVGGVQVTAEKSIGYFQINVCNFPLWEYGRLYNARENAGTAHMLWSQRGWSPWYFSAKQLGLI